MYRLLMMFLLSLDIISQALQETFGDDSDVTSALKFLHNAYPNGRWWLKSDDTDIQEGLRESMRNEWSGDVDIGDELKDRASSDNIKEDLQQMCSKLSSEKDFLTNVHADAKKYYKSVHDMANSTEKALLACA
ncbi:Hypothetical predicted protein [Paramuricea clavata]|uniref:Uncharacterized protein n=1 Tax=Paramuricea clavata TaxID=317549 RepID=A0A7D9JBW2_PARCT|nr:Hypothetical predicted protein [Paramuricea clavata]